MLSKQQVYLFRETVWEYYRAHGRDLPWRHPVRGGDFDPYRIMVSEVMLQQTQVPRVIPKYQEFLHQFPDVYNLSRAPLADVLTVWSGLGYNRRAKFLHQAAKQVVTEHNGTFPTTLNMLTNLPGIGPNTAAAILAYAYNQPQVFVETNIRTVFIHHFFPDQENIDDKQLLPLIEQALDRENPRTWYWALMDYGTHIKALHGNAARASKHYAKQSSFKGSLRQIRGAVLRNLASTPASEKQLDQQIRDARLIQVLESLENEGLIHRVRSEYRLGAKEA